jgi:hypothetical protein
MAWIPYEVIPPQQPEQPTRTPITLDELCCEAAEAARKASTNKKAKQP